MAHKKVGWLKDSTMKADGIFSPSGEKLVSGNFDKKAQDEFNGKKKKAEKKKESLTSKIKKKFTKK